MRTALLLATLVASTPAPATIRGVLHGFPRINQLTEVATDGHKSENAEMNCIPASIAAGLRYLTGKSYSGDSVKEAVYGSSYKGPTQIYKYLDFVKDQGVVMRPVLSHNSETLVAELRKLLEAGAPVVLSIPGDINRPPTDLLHPSSVTHVVVAAGFDENGNIRVMNPWGGVWLDGSDAFWASRICYGELWAMESDGAVRPLDATPRIQTVARDLDDALDKSAAAQAAEPRTSEPMRVFKALAKPVEAAVAAPRR